MIINSRTGTIVIGQHVRIEPVAVTHGNLVVTITEDFQVSQPNPLAEGDTVVVPETQINVDDGGDNRMFKFDAGVTRSADYAYPDHDLYLSSTVFLLATRASRAA